MKKINLRSLLSVLILITTTVLLISYIAKHPEYIQVLLRTSPYSVLWLFLINIGLIAALVGIGHYTVQIAGKKLDRKENIILTIYSSIANFFGPLQSGPGVRAIYLKKKHSIRLRDFTFATLIYYALFAIINSFFMVIGARPWWQAILAVIAATGISYICIRWFMRRDKQENVRTFHLTTKLVTGLILFTMIQCLFMVARYYVDLRSTQTEVTISQAVSYTGAANMALFVSITPDGIGIREAFLLFTQKLHGIPTESIISASLIDRASYILFLAILFIFVFGIHAKDKLNLKNSK